MIRRNVFFKQFYFCGMGEKVQVFTQTIKCKPRLTAYANVEAKMAVNKNV